MEPQHIAAVEIGSELTLRLLVLSFSGKGIAAANNSKWRCFRPMRTHRCRPNVMGPTGPPERAISRPIFSVSTDRINVGAMCNRVGNVLLGDNANHI